MKLLRVVFLLLLSPTALSFTVPSTTTRPSLNKSSNSLRESCLGMVKYDGTKWVAETDAEQQGYGIVQTFLRHGPTPTLRRVLQPSQYEQAVLKFMAQEGCDRREAQGNMDCYFRNPNDWVALRLAQEKTGIKLDLVTVDPLRAVLVTVWTGLLILFVQQFLARVQTGDIDFSKNHQFDFLFDILYMLS